jgi:ankyrin repeat protein
MKLQSSRIMIFVFVISLMLDPIVCHAGSDSDPALIRALKDYNAQEANQLISQGADVNSKDSTGWTALMYAATYGYIDTVELLVNRGADVSARDYTNQQTALMCSDKIEITKILIDAGAQVNVVDSFVGWTPLFRAAMKGNNEIVKLLIAKGADVNAKTPDGETALSTAQEHHLSDTVEILKAAGAKE